MALVPIDPIVSPASLPEGVLEFLRESDERIQQFLLDRTEEPIVGFVPSDFPSVYSILRSITESRSASGPLFCEWGSGFGVVSCLASMLEFDAYGIEIEEDLVEAATRLAEDFDFHVEFTPGNFIPQAVEMISDRYSTEFVWLASGGEDAHERIGLDPSDFDVIFAYPWPNEEDVIFDLFEAQASFGALLVTYHGIEGIRVQRKVR